MNINELREGNKVRYKCDRLPGSDRWSNIKEGFFYGFVTGRGPCCCIVDGNYIKKEDIIAKLEQIQPEYKVIPIEQEAPPKKSESFKFDVSLVRSITFRQEPYYFGGFQSPNFASFEIEGCQIKFNKDNPDFSNLNGKTLTVEIKEKKD